MSKSEERTVILKKKAEQIVFCSLLALLAFIPFLNGTVSAGGDTAFYFNRIEALSSSLREHVIPSVYRTQNYGYGYGTPLFLPDLFMYIPAFFRLHMTLLSAYRLFVYLVLNAQAMSMYSVTEKVIKNDRTARYLSTLLFVCCTYCWASLMNNGTLSESISAIFVPQVIYGLYSLLAEGAWYRLAVSLSGMMLSDPVLGVMMSAVCVILCIRHHALFSRNRNTLKGAAMAAVTAAGIPAGYFITAAEQLFSGDYYVRDLFLSSANLTGQTEWAGLLDLIPSGYPHLLHSVGFGLLFLPLLSLKARGKYASFAREIMLAGYILLLGSFRLFPWMIIPFAGILEYPQRLFYISAGCLAFAAGYGFSHASFRKKDREYIRKSLAGICLLSAVLMISVQFNIVGSVSRYRDINSTDGASPALRYNEKELGRGLFLPKNNYVYSAGNRTAHHISQIAEFTEDAESCSCPYEGGGSYVFPVTWYKGYTVSVMHNGGEIYKAETAADTASGLVSFELPDDLPADSTAVLAYRSTALQRTGTVISMTVFILSAVFAVMQRLQEKKA